MASRGVLQVDQPGRFADPGPPTIPPIDSLARRCSSQTVTLTGRFLNCCLALAAMACGVRCRGFVDQVPGQAGRLHVGDRDALGRRADSSRCRRGDDDRCGRFGYCFARQPLAGHGPPEGRPHRPRPAPAEVLLGSAKAMVFTDPADRTAAPAASRSCMVSGLDGIPTATTDSAAKGPGRGYATCPRVCRRSRCVRGPGRCCVARSRATPH